MRFGGLWGHGARPCSAWVSPNRFLPISASLTVFFEGSLVSFGGPLGPKRPPLPAAGASPKLAKIPQKNQKKKSLFSSWT
ncbi:MAG: hypothetical protein SP1CHLAM54_17560 [Chlamydiia bacterium]|nr:hypothetical protein [Chlamydiia bacterium]MCH9616644.1 hypothetical protein [Chlamydiia bacterium]